MTESTKRESKGAFDHKRNKTPISISGAFPKWRDLRDRIGLKLDSELAALPLDSIQFTCKIMAGTGGTSTKGKRRQTEEQRQAERDSDRARGKTRVNLGRAFNKWRKLRETKGFKTDPELALFLMDSYLRTESENRPERPVPDGSSSDETSVHFEHPPVMSSLKEVERETCAASSVKSSENGKESQNKNAACQRLKIQDEQTTTGMSENKESRDTQNKDEDEEFSTSLSVGDGRYLVDLGSSSEFVVDEECILQLFKSCRKCNRRCSVRKDAKGLKLVVYQSCLFCKTCCKWTNLPDDDDSVISGHKSVHGQTNSAEMPGRNTS